MRNDSPSNDSSGEPPKTGIARDLHALAQDEDVDVDELLAEARREVDLDG